MTTEAQHIVQQYRTGTIDRREFARILAAAGLTMTMVPLTHRAAAAQSDITVFEWSGYELPEFHQAYIDQYGASPSFTFFGELEEALQKLRTGFTADVTHPCTSSIGRWYDAGAIAPVDVARLTHWEDIFPSMRDIKALNRDGNVLGVPFDWGNSSILYRTDLVEPKEQSYNLYLDERYAGQMAFFDSADGFAQVTGLIQGVDPFNMTEEQLAAAGDIMRQIQGNLRFYWTDPTEIEQALASGEVVLAYSWNGSAANLKAQGIPVTFMDPKEGILTWVCCVALGSAGSGSEQQAYDFINAMTSPEAGKNLIDLYGYGHSNTKAFDLVDQAKLDELGISDPDAMMAKGTFIEEMQPATRERVIEIFDDVKAGM